MYDGKQVLRIENHFKKSDLYNIGVEMTERKGTGNYDKNRTEFNVEYISMKEKNLYQEIKQNLKKRNIEYSDKPTTNLLNGVTFTSGIEFFESLGMKLKNTDRIYQSGDKKGQIVKVPNIKSKDDIPQAVTYFFDSCMDFLKDYVGEENIVLAQIHYDEDTPHLQAYFMPILNEINKKCYEKDNNGNIIKEKYTNKNGEISFKSKLLRDEFGKIVYKKVKGNFLNNDQFWKNKGGKNSFFNAQNSFNKFINERGFNLDRGEIGANKKHTTKLEYELGELKAELKDLREEKDYSLKEIENTKNALIKATKSREKDILNPKRNVVGYNSKDVSEIIEYSKNLEQIKIIQENEIKSKDLAIKRLSDENKSFKNNKEIKRRNNLIKEQKSTINNQKQEINRLNDLINILENNIEDLKEKFDNEINKWKKRFKKLCNAIDKVLGRKPKKYVEDYEDLADSIIYNYYDENKDNDKDDFNISL